MGTVISGIGLLILTLAAFSFFSFKFPRGQQAMSGMANAAVATFLVEAIHHYITGELVGIQFLNDVGIASGGMGGVAAAIMVPLAMGANPVIAMASGVACANFGILPGFIAGYIVGLLSRVLERALPPGPDVIVGALIVAPLARLIAYIVEPGVTTILTIIGGTIEEATTISPILMGFLLGGIMKMICTSPLSSMALTAMIGLTGLPMGIAAIACFGGSFTNGIIFKRLHLGDNGKVLAVMMEPLTQADIITTHPIPIYGSNFFGGGLAGIGAAALGIINNAPGTASPIPGLLAPFAFNAPLKVVLALLIAAVGGTIAGFAGSIVFKKYDEKEQFEIIEAEHKEIQFTREFKSTIMEKFAEGLDEALGEAVKNGGTQGVEELVSALFQEKKVEPKAETPEGAEKGDGK